MTSAFQDSCYSVIRSLVSGMIVFALC